ncbi:hypothetical protein KC19_1G095300 [Ceratodon purpureus]|uniref:Uncharacterized protein n=1 Tax=Ceratodon purpureus TaxID=3225 RepID=A0A8T0J375_CERPU|nr:hypothetical protein KC19_1G095300 [Ceratodon purpureus]
MWCNPSGPPRRNSSGIDSSSWTAEMGKKKLHPTASEAEIGGLSLKISSGQYGIPILARWDDVSGTAQRLSNGGRRTYPRATKRSQEQEAGQPNNRRVKK